MGEQELEELREKAEYGRKAQAAMDIFNDFLIYKRASLISFLENDNSFLPNERDIAIALLKALRQFENWVISYIDIGEIAEKELNNDGR